MVIIDDEIHYLGEDLAVSFEVTVNGKPVRPFSITVDVYYVSSGNKFLFSEIFRPDKTEILYLLKREKIERAGDYTLEFSCRLSKYGLHTLIYKTRVKSPGKRNVKSKELTKAS